MVSFVPERFQDNLRDLMCKLWVIIKIYTGKDQVHVTEYKQFCLSVYYLILDSFNNQETRWINISPTLHALLAHSWELISNNDGRGLGEFSEGGLEHNNKFLRFYRRNLARKVNQTSNMEDCLTRLWLRSDPLIRSSGPSPPVCKRCKGDHYTVYCPQKLVSLSRDTNMTLEEQYLSELTY